MPGLDLAGAVHIQPIAVGNDLMWGRKSLSRGKEHDANLLVDLEAPKSSQEPPKNPPRVPKRSPREPQNECKTIFRSKTDEKKSIKSDKKSSKKLCHRLTRQQGKGEESSLVARGP